MGDGRYYTYFQFADVIILTLISALSVASIFFFYYRKSRDMNISYIIAPSLIILGFSISRLVESLIPNLLVASNLRAVQLVLILASIAVCVLNKNFIDKNVKIILLIALVLGFASVFLDIIFKNYEFHNVSYSSYYKGLILFMVIALSSYLLIKKDVLNKHKFILIILPLGIYTFTTYKAYNVVCYMEFLISLCIIIYTNLVFAYNSELSYSVLAFDKIGNISTNYIFVTDNMGKVIYSNDMVKMSEFFGNIEHIDSITGIFECDISRSYTHLDKEYINIKRGNENYYYTYSYSQLNNDGKVIGNIITITNITDLIMLLNNLEDKKSESKKINSELRNYSKIVYNLEKEKEINNLLEEIVITRDEQMNYLMALIEETKSRIDDIDFENYIEISIEKSNEILEDVRKTVTKYREYYGG